jgi:hypothetical protein
MSTKTSIATATILAALATLTFAVEPGFAHTRDVKHATQKIRVQPNVYNSVAPPTQVAAPNRTYPPQPRDFQLEGRF